MGSEESKIDLAKEIIHPVGWKLKVKVRWVCFDAFHGRDSNFLCSLIKMRPPFVAYVPDNLHIWLEPFQMRVPVREPGKRG
ncbi:hypothetical protein DXN04_32000 [Chitinophaga silvisoli]|uniref:Uncharacterized protein n=2 Tax=Chitinophaga silvisoli TaxID=2291814 RepID=A0A3E1NS20_9BACT|nr:hypothetical protein DXN04_32000 [Chitinophaga silvisoli]